MGGLGKWSDPLVVSKKDCAVQTEVFPPGDGSHLPMGGASSQRQNNIVQKMESEEALYTKNHTEEKECTGDPALLLEPDSDVTIGSTCTLSDQFSDRPSSDISLDEEEEMDFDLLEEGEVSLVENPFFSKFEKQALGQEVVMGARRSLAGLKVSEMNILNVKDYIYDLAPFKDIQKKYTGSKTEVLAVEKKMLEDVQTWTSLKNVDSGDCKSGNEVREKIVGALNPIKCDECGKRFPADVDENTLINHVKTEHIKEKEREISLQFFDNVAVEKRAGRSLRIKEGPFSCPFCPLVTTRSQGLQRHIRRTHKEDEDHLDLLTCPFCSFTTSWRNSMLRHVHKKHELSRTEI